MPALTMGRKRRFDVLFFAFFQIHCAQQRRVARRYWKAFHICPHHLQQQRMLHPSSLEAALTAISQTRLITQYEPMGIARIQFWRHQARWNKCCFLCSAARLCFCVFGNWRRGSESNRPRRICNPLHNRFATAPEGHEKGKLDGFPFSRYVERETSLELATSTLARLRSTN